MPSYWKQGSKDWQRGAWKGGDWQYDWQQGAWKGGCSHDHGWSEDADGWSLDKAAPARLAIEDADGWSQDVCAAFCANRLPLDEACRYPHDSGGWLRAFTLAGNGTSQPDMRKIRALRTLIWAQTQRVCRGESCQCMADPDLEDPPSYTYSVHAPPRVFTAGGYGACLQPFPHCDVAECDMLDHAEDLVRQGLSVAILNMAAATKPGGGVHWGAGAQEENLHRRSDAMRFTMDQESCNYPLIGAMCLLSHGVTIFRGNEHIGYPFLDKPFKVTMISCAAPKYCDFRTVTGRQYMDGKVAAIVQALMESACDAAVLSAFGCGAFRNPPELVAEVFHKHLAHPVLYHSGLKQVTFCIVNDHNSFRTHNPMGNVIPFSNLFSETGPGAMPTLQAGRHAHFGGMPTSTEMSRFCPGHSHGRIDLAWSHSPAGEW